jgi:hypothetical protein
LNNPKEIYTHVGLGKTGSTFLQLRVFPKFDGIKYIPTNRYRKITQLIQKSKENKILVSREFDQQLEQEVKKFSSNFPDATPIIVFRRHDSYIASQYRRFVKNGFKGSFKDFIDLEDDNGYFKKSDLDFERQINILKKHFTKEPVVLMYDDLRNDARQFVVDFANHITATVDLNKIDFSKKHTSYSEKQLKGIKWFGEYFNMRKRRVFKNGILHFLWRLFFGAIRYTMLFIFRLLPATCWDQNPLISGLELKEIRDFYSSDWDVCLKYAEATKMNRE